MGAPVAAVVALGRDVFVAFELGGEFCFRDKFWLLAPYSDSSARFLFMDGSASIRLDSGDVPW